ncbi:hypothetical protein EYC80_007423 [Monilinia laxa]|uniref:Heterokaryon incompatibility domain-containing protein n=1 Tax=Monilinia laxa TaxID=61186 RepID=A0A5N6JVY3_MONLA|nr:hypothetical protein EYC80_007423 [Monilinia laxa]
MTTNNHFLILDRPCKYCKVLELKDLQHGGRMQHDQNGNPYVDFGEVEVTEAMEADKGTKLLELRKGLRAASGFNPKEPEVLPRSELKLGYKRSDLLPNLPGLTATAHQGCAFCKVLRDDLISANLQDETLDKEESCAKKGANPTEIVITEVTYQLRGFETYPKRHENDPRAWLDALYVYLTVNSGGENIKKSLHYNFCTDASDPCAKWFTLGRLPVANERLSAPTLDRIKALIGRALQEKPIESLRLVITKSDPDISKLDPTQKRYAALSYCWGTNSDTKLQLKTTYDTLNSHLEASGKPIGPPDDPSNADFGDAAWAKRGWTFQEDQLSPRKLYFGKRMVYMSAGKLCEAADGTGFSRKTYFNFESTLEQTLSECYNLVGEYTKRKLCFEQDRFPAISALTRTICDRFPSQRYLAGLWESDLHKGLLWTTPSWLEFDKYYKPPGTKYIAPSWSWACRPYKIIWISGIGEDVKYSSEFTLNHAEILTARENPYGRVSTGRLSIRGKLFKPPMCEHGRVRIKNNEEYYKFLTIVFNYILWSENDKYIAHIFLDWDYYSALHDDGYPRGPVDQLSLLLVSRTSLDQDFMFQSYDLTDQEVMLGILIRPVPGMNNEYEKLGIWYSENRDLGGVKFWEEIPSQELILV